MKLEPRRLAAIARADLLERFRRPAFIVTLGFALWAASAFTPPADAPYATLQIGGHRGVYNSAWIGAMTAILSAIFFSFVGFYLVRSAVEFDRRTGVGAILATTPMSRVEYTLGKWLANFGVLVAMIAVLVVGVAAMQIARGEDRHLEPLAIVAPFVWLVLPSMSIASGAAVLFETTPGLRGGFGNAVFFFVWMPALAVPRLDLHSQNPWIDPLGLYSVLAQIIHAAAERFPDVRAHPDHYSMGITFRTGGWHLETFRWEGTHWTPALILSRFCWFAVGPLLAILAALPFDRFAGERALGGGKPRGRSATAAVPLGGEPATTVAPMPALEERSGRMPAAPRAAGGMAAAGGLLVAELRLLFNGLPPIWYLVPLGLIVASAFVPIAAAGRLAAIAWVWPVLRWSQLGARDRRSGTEALLLSSPRPIGRQLAAAWNAGFLLAFAMGSGLALRALLHGDLATFAAIACGAAFVPAMALALGTWTGAPKTFEVLYLVLWYAGPLNQIPFLDFSGGSGPGPASGFALAAAVLLGLSAFGRSRRLRG